MTPSSAVWRLTDGKPGHENQTLGLARALALPTHDIPAPAPARALVWWLTGRFPPGDELPDPALILAAGHRTHLALLAARRARGGRAVVLMRPSLPLALFDLAVVPEHDAPPHRPDVLTTRGVLNAVRPGGPHHPDQGLFLIGGPSRHHAWEGDEIAAQVRAICRQAPAVDWTLTTSRRTPQATLVALQDLKTSNLTVVPAAQTGPGWVPRALADAGVVWVSEDSVSMVYEALTSAAACGVLAVPRRGMGRVTQGLDALVAEGWVRRYAPGEEVAPWPTPAAFDEAGRIARLLRERWPELAVQT